MTRLTSGLLLVLGALCGCRATTKPAPNAESATQATHDIDRSSMDTSVAAGDDFFRYANGTWLKTAAIPPDRGSYGIWYVLFDRSQQRTKALLEEAAAGKGTAGPDDRKAGDYFASYLDDATIEKPRTAAPDA